MTNPKVPIQACWMVKKILGAKAHLHILQQDNGCRGSKIRQAYHQLLGEHTKVEWRKLVCRNPARPKAIIILWLQIQNRLLTTDRLLKWRMWIDPQCVLSDETRDHLFCECEYTQALWGRLLRWININQPMEADWNTRQQWIIMETRGKRSQAQMMQLIYTGFIYAIWKERNTRIFQKTETTIEDNARKIACVLC